MRSLINRLRPGRSDDHSTRDPAPSRLKYRMQRWMLTPGIRLGLRIGVPFGLVFVAAGAFLADEQRRDDLNMYVAQLRASFEERPEFMVGVMAIDGAGSNLAEDIREVVPIDFPVSQFDLDLEEIRKLVIGLDPVKTASIRIRPGGVLQLDVVERRPVVLWRGRDGLELLDDTGTRIDSLTSRASRPDLPLIAGEGANDHVREALNLISAARPLGKRLRGLVRIGERRWDVVLDRSQLIQLPSERPIPALERVLAVSQVRDLLERDVSVVDMRLSRRPTVRMTENAVQDWWRIREINGGGQ
jgi:cell division protein FtsQ